MGTSSLSSPLILHHIFRPPRPLSTSLQTTPLRSFFVSLYSRPLLFSHALSSSPSLSLSSSPPHSLSTFNAETQTPVEDETGYDVEFESGSEDFDPEEEEIVSDRSERVSNPSKSTADNGLLAKLPDLTVKEKKELASYAHSLGKKLKSQQVGKSGVTDCVATALVETLEANELLKLKIHSNCPGELDDVVNQLVKTTGSVVVSRIGRTVILYRPSLTKLKAEEKKRQARRVFVRKPLSPKLPMQNKAPSWRFSGRRGSSRY